MVAHANDRGRMTTGGSLKRRAAFGGRLMARRGTMWTTPGLHGWTPISLTLRRPQMSVPSASPSAARLDVSLAMTWSGRPGRTRRLDPAREAGTIHKAGVPEVAQPTAARGAPMVPRLIRIAGGRGIASPSTVRPHERWSEIQYIVRLMSAQAAPRGHRIPSWNPLFSAVPSTRVAAWLPGLHPVVNPHIERPAMSRRMTWSADSRATTTITSRSTPTQRDDGPVLPTAIRTPAPGSLHTRSGGVSRSMRLGAGHRSRSRHTGLAITMRKTIDIQSSLVMVRRAMNRAALVVHPVVGRRKPPADIGAVHRLERHVKTTIVHANRAPHPATLDLARAPAFESPAPTVGRREEIPCAETQHKKPAPTPAIDLNALSRKVYDEIERRVRSERERRGL